MDYSLPGSFVHGISQARILEWVAISFSRGSSWPRNRTQISCTGRQILYHWATREALFDPFWPSINMYWIHIPVSLSFFMLKVGAPKTVLCKFCSPFFCLILVSLKHILRKHLRGWPTTNNSIFSNEKDLWLCVLGPGLELRQIFCVWKKTQS